MPRIVTLLFEELHRGLNVDKIAKVMLNNNTFSNINDLQHSKILGNRKHFIG